MSTCGLDHTLLGGADDATVFNYPHRVTETYGLHGRYTGLPARLAGYGAAWDGDDCVLWAEGEVLQAALFGEQLHAPAADRGRPGRGRRCGSPTP